MKVLSLFDYLKPKPVEVKGFMYDGYCPTCGSCLDDLIPECPWCNTVLNWDRWKYINGYGEELS